jgi:hypothetical protein
VASCASVIASGLTPSPANALGRYCCNTLHVISHAGIAMGRVPAPDYFARPAYPCAISGIATTWLRALGVPQPP